MQKLCTSFKVVYLKDKMLSLWGYEDMKIKSIADKTKKPVLTSYVLLDYSIWLRMINS